MRIRPVHINHAEQQFHRWGTGLVLAGRVIHGIQDKDDRRISDHPPEMREDGGVVSGNSRFGRIDGMGKRKQVGDLFECAPDQIQVEAGATQACTEVGQQRSAETGDEGDETEEDTGQAGRRRCLPKGNRERGTQKAEIAR